MNKIAMYEMILEDHPLWTKEAGEARRARIVKSIMKKAPQGWGAKGLTPGLEQAFRTAHSKSTANLPRVVQRVGQPKMQEQLGKVMTPGALNPLIERTILRGGRKDPFAQVVNAGLTRQGVPEEINKINTVTARGFLNPKL